MTEWPEIRWTENGTESRAAFVSLRAISPPDDAVTLDSRRSPTEAIANILDGRAVLWKGDYQSARRTLSEIGRALGRHVPPPPGNATAFEAFREGQAWKSKIMALLLVPIQNGAVSLPRAQPTALALEQSFGPLPPRAITPLRDVLTAISAFEWRRNGVPVAALGGAKIHPHFGVFPPTRQDYVDLVAKAPLPEDTSLAFEIGTGTGVLGAVLLHRGVERVIATDNAPRAVACATENFTRLSMGHRARVLEISMFPPGRAPLLVCNPPWLPGPADTSLESAVYDPDSAMVRAFLGGARTHMTERGEAWLIMSNLAEELGLRQAEALPRWIRDAGLVVLEQVRADHVHRQSTKPNDPIAGARSRETVSLWRLGTSQPLRP